LSANRLDNYLTSKKHYESRARAASAIKAGKVTINGKVITKPAAKVPAGAVVEFEQEHPWVSRGGLKLAHGLEVFNVDVAGRICLDVGSSTGGFTEVLLSEGAVKVYAVDVGQGQLHKKLRGHHKIISMEKTDARTLTAEMFSPLPDVIVCDASFISAAKVLETSLEFAARNTHLVTLVKPQFEVGKDNIGRGGLVKDPALGHKALDDFGAWLRCMGWKVLATDISPVTGGDGNTEYLLHACKKRVAKNKPGKCRAWNS